MVIKLGIECGQSLWRPRSWRLFSYHWHFGETRETSRRIRHFTFFRRFKGGFAVGPIMVWRQQ